MKHRLAVRTNSSFSADYYVEYDTDACTCRIEGLYRNGLLLDRGVSKEQIYRLPVSIDARMQALGITDKLLLTPPQPNLRNLTYSELMHLLATAT